MAPTPLACALGHRPQPDGQKQGVSCGGWSLNQLEGQAEEGQGLRKDSKLKGMEGRVGEPELRFPETAGLAQLAGEAALAFRGGRSVLEYFDKGA